MTHGPVHRPSPLAPIHLYDCSFGSIATVPALGITLPLGANSAPHAYMPLPTPYVLQNMKHAPPIALLTCA
jgi:hypothetical protein